ncbi:MAG: pyruvate kinase, partial [Candidatus Omnitrophica bacterium]|nr:pyruvate kinase [Candidatus Omnitrophota bacterium]
LSENKGINLPSAPATLPALSVRDRAMLKAARGFDVDYVALSFVRNGADLRILKNYLNKIKLQTGLIAKIEKPSALENIDAIMHASDGIMIARGDLGIELGVEKVPPVQKDLIRRADCSRVPVIVATQMLESMMDHPRPLRAEASDIANAVFDGADAMMLSGETAVGKYPRQTVRTMAAIIEEAEKVVPAAGHSIEEGSVRFEEMALRSVAHAARDAAVTLRAEAIVVFTRTGLTAELVSALRPPVPILVLTEGEKERHWLALYRGVYGQIMRWGGDTGTALKEADRILVKKFGIHRGASVVVVSGQDALPGMRYAVKMHRVGEMEKS